MSIASLREDVHTEVILQFNCPWLHGGQISRLNGLNQTPSNSMYSIHGMPSFHFLPLLQFTTHKVRASWSARDRPLLPKRVVVPINSWFPAGLSKCNLISYIWQDPIIILVPYFPDMMWVVLQIGVITPFNHTFVSNDKLGWFWGPYWP